MLVCLIQFCHYFFWGGSGWVGWPWTCDPFASAYFFSKSHQHVPLQLTSSVLLSVRVGCCKLTLWCSFCYVSEALVCCVWSHFNLFWEWFCFLFLDPLAVQEWVACFVCICMTSVFFSLWFLVLVHHVQIKIYKPETYSVTYHMADLGEWPRYSRRDAHCAAVGVSCICLVGSAGLGCSLALLFLY